MTLGVGFLGAGDISPLHAEGVRSCTDARLVGLWSLDEPLGRTRGEEFGCAVYDSAEALVASPEVDVVFVLTNLETHAQYTHLALRAGKHVIVEKPAGVDVEEIAGMRDAARAAGLTCSPVHNYVYEPSLERTQRLITSGRLGQVVATYIHYHIHHPEVVAARYPGVIRQILTHHCSIMLYLGGTPRWISAMKSTLNDGSVTQENVAMLQCEMEDGALCHFTASFAADDHSADPWTMLVKVIGTGGATRYSYRDWVENVRPVVHSHTFSAYPETIHQTVRSLLTETILGGRPPRSSLDDAITAQRMLDAAERSIAERRHIELVQ